MLHKVDEWLAPWLQGCCVLCGQPAVSGRSCTACRADLPWIRSACVRCGRPLPAGVAAGLCAGCDLALDGLASVAAALVYEFPVDWLVTAAKFHGRLDCARALGELLARSAAAAACRAEPPDLVLPVPLHPARLGERGYNQAAELAKALARCLGVGLSSQVAERRRNTAAQSGLSPSARRANVRSAFRLRWPLSGARVLLVDDVVTTGQTLSSLATSCVAAGAADVRALCAARVVSSQPLRKV